MNKKRKAIIESNEISTIETFSLGGYKQKVLIEGKSSDLPIVICLHGGPGAPIPFSVGGRGLFPQLTNKFIMVYWDQLGCGINNYEIGNDFAVDMFKDMTVDLIKAVKAKFPYNRLFLFAVSWGSVLSAKSVCAVPELVDGVVVYGQVLKELSFNEEVFDTLVKSTAPKKVKESIKSLRKKDEYTVSDLKLIAKYIRKYSDGYQNKNGKTVALSSIIKGLLFSPDYKLRDFIAIIKNGYLKNESLFFELMKIDNSDVLSKVSKPYYIIQGSTDIVTSTKAISEFVRTSGNDNLHCEIVSDSGHIPGGKALDVIRDRLAQIASRN